MSGGGNGRWRGLPEAWSPEFERLVGRVRAAYPVLSPRQAAVALGVWRSLGDKEIAAWPGCSPHTVREYQADVVLRLTPHGVERCGDIIRAVERAMRASEGGGP